jgi:ferritin-like metal-binding protein YciE
MKQALASLGGSHPVIREGVSKVINLVAGLGTSLASDTPVKNAIADFATEHFEIACYTTLVQTATALGEKKIAATCKAILREEEAMAKGLRALFPEINAAYLDKLDDDIAEEKHPSPKRTARERKSVK